MKMLLLSASTSIFIALLAGIGGLAASSSLLGVGNTLRDTTACAEIAASISLKSAVYYNGSDLYTKDNYHWASSSTQVSACTFEPGTTEDLVKAIQILGATRTPFGVKSGGHTTNPGFSSTPGVQIAMYLFSDITYDSDSQTAKVGTGAIWDDVYLTLEEYGVNVLGGKVTGVGVGGVILGGGFSYLTNQHGLAIDNVVSFELILPNGTVTTVTSSSNPDLYFGLRGGFNNFGIVTYFTLKTYPQSQIWGGSLAYSQDQVEAVNAAVAKFVANVADPKASIYSTYNYVSGSPVLSSSLFYDAPTAPDGMFDDFLAISNIGEDISTRSFSSMIDVEPVNNTIGLRAVFNAIAIEEWTEPLLSAVANETLFYGNKLANSSVVEITYNARAYLPSIFSHSDIPSAYPDSRARGYSYLEVFYAWKDSKDDDFFYDIVATSSGHMVSLAVAAGQDVANVVVYPNNAQPSTPIEDLYGTNLPRLRDIKAAIDPDNVMGLAGGWKV
ncbi:FAD-binding domain-containing protein [Suillus paluster]|uniref:FAD-binding domain-containing protein n=1 Tax=Suillus paluster TaxID=48578 RepID=UPI001B87E294|nr:FAD-binding domain-containing protein [Suillus paluster]KAG1747826.1 FAD-binding domain-containing protein [Suillus paluster]